MSGRRTGSPLPHWRPPERPERRAIEGRFVRLEPLAAEHAGALHAAFAVDEGVWDYLYVGPFTEAGFRDWVEAQARAEDPVYFALVTAAGPQGVASLMRIAPAAGSIEVGGICLAPQIQRTSAASEMVFLFADWAFGAGYRRFEWKCDALNAASRRAAKRFGFSYEGTFRQAAVYKGRNRDTAWFAMTDGDWRGGLRAAWQEWLDPENFDPEGRQRRQLGPLTEPFRVPPAGEEEVSR